MSSRRSFAMQQPMFENPDVKMPNSESVDSRLKLLLAVVAVASVFATFSWLRLGLLSIPALAILVKLDIIPPFLQRLYWLRWFFLFIILLHLLLSPGFTLFGISWLSRDGLFRGMAVCLQIVLALAFSMALTRSTSAERLAAATVSLLRPVKLFRMDVEAFASQILLALHFVPVLQEESLSGWRDFPPPRGRLAFTDRISRLQSLVVPVLLRLVDRADRMAFEAASEPERKTRIGILSPLWPLGFAEWSLLGAAVLVAALYFGLP